ncbi:MAG: ribosomal protein S18-alanine N-acetyltransferase [Actinomycetota bacterium]|jgi:ribosomal-protein-alanine N-acetyltransferase|nr:ribosomal protein S18-alanine N-acetyltransferase [Actinomycetota bacterium]
MVASERSCQTRRAAVVEVTRMRRRHLRQVLAIEGSVYPRPWSPGLFAAEIGQLDTRRYLVAQQGRRWRPEVLGYAGVMVVMGEAHITTVAVHPAHHRRKVASCLLVGLLEQALTMGAKAATLEVRVANRGAQRLYAGFGFVPAGIRPGYYAETAEDALIMWAHDLGSIEFARRLEFERGRLQRPGGDSGAPDLQVPWVTGRVGLDASDGHADGDALGRQP